MEAFSAGSKKLQKKPDFGSLLEKEIRCLHTIADNRKSSLLKFSAKSKINSKEWFFDAVNWMKRSTDRDLVNRGRFQAALGKVLVFAQFFAMMPVIGVTNPSATQLYFNWKSIRAMYTAIIFVLAAAYLTIVFFLTLSKQITFNSIVILAFFTTTTFGILNFMLLAKKWPELMQRWEFVESILPRFKNNEEKRHLAKKIRNISCIVISVCVVEHILNMASIINATILNAPEKDPIEELFTVQLPLLFTITPFSIWKAAVCKWLNLVLTFAWSYMDLFIMIISVGLASQFRQLNESLARVKKEEITEEFLILRRMQYRQLCTLCAEVDKCLSKIILIAFANNHFFICVQLLRSLKPMPSAVQTVYFWFSLIFLIMRTLAVSLYAAEIHEQSKKPINILRAIPRNAWCDEARRFTEEVVTDTVALSGMRFFFITRKLLLAVTGTIATYELVIVQFHTDD